MGIKKFALLLWLCPLILRAQDSAFPDGPGKATMVRICSACHDLGPLTGLSGGTDMWQSVVDDMRVRGADGTEQDFKDIVAYLAKYRGVPAPTAAPAAAKSSGATAAAAEANGPVYAVAHIDVTPDHAAETAALVKQYAADSKKDPGSVRIDALLQDGRTNHFTIVEEWQTRAAFEAHTALAHTVQFREKLHPFLGSPYDERLHEAIP